MRLPQLACAILLFCGWMSPGLAQDLTTPPPGRMLDDSHVFNAVQHAEMEQLLAGLAGSTTVEGYFVTFTYITEGTVAERARALSASWLPDKPGFILTYNRGAAQPAFAVSQGFWERYPTDEVATLAVRTGEFLNAADATLDERLAGCLRFVSNEIIRMESARVSRMKPFTRDDLKLGAILAGALLILGLTALYLGGRYRRRQGISAESFEFPEVEVGTRLGAPFGGGTASEAGIKD